MHVSFGFSPPLLDPKPEPGSEGGQDAPPAGADALCDRRDRQESSEVQQPGLHP